MRPLVLVIAILSAGVSASSQTLFTALGADPGEVGRPEPESEQTRALVVRTAPASQQNLGRAALPAIEGQAVREPLSRRSAALQMLCRAQLKARLNRILTTRDTATGLVVSVPSSLLSNQQALPRKTSEKLARIAEIIPSDVTVRVEGYTDDQGTAARNQKVSFGLAETVRDVLVENDNVPRTILATGFVSNAMAKARAQRCVQIVIAGQGIGQAVLLARTSRFATRNGGLTRGQPIVAMNGLPRASRGR